MLEFNLQRFTDEDKTIAEPETSAAETTSETGLPEELNGLPEEIARETLEEWEKSQPTQESESAPAEPETYSREEYQAKVSEIEQLKALLAESQKQKPQAPAQQPAPQPQPQTFQPPQMKITLEDAAKINKAIEAEAKAISGMSDDDIASLDWADEDDPRVAQWQQSKTIAQNNVMLAIQQAQFAQYKQTQDFLAEHTAAINTYNEFAQKEFAEPDFKEIQQFATNEFFEGLTPSEQKILANSYIRIERQTASPAEMLVVKNYYERAKAAFRSKGAQAKKPTQTPQERAQQAAQLPRSDQLKGTTTTSDGQLSAHDIEELLKGDFTEIDPKIQNIMLQVS